MTDTTPTQNYYWKMQEHIFTPDEIRTGEEHTFKVYDHMEIVDQAILDHGILHFWTRSLGTLDAFSAAPTQTATLRIAEESGPHFSSEGTPVAPFRKDGKTYWLVLVRQTFTD